MKNGKRAYLDCIARCARGFRCRHAGDRVGRHRCALVGADSGPDHAPRHRRIWYDILRKGQRHEHR